MRLVTDITGAVVWSERYRPFGSEADPSTGSGRGSSIQNNYRFTGKAWDAAAGLFYFNARWYGPETGRFISEDPLWGNILDPQSLNRFAYGRNNPFRFTDPTGMFNIGKEIEEGNFGLEAPGYDGSREGSFRAMMEAIEQSAFSSNQSSESPIELLYSDGNYNIPDPYAAPKWERIGEPKVKWKGSWKLTGTIPPKDALAAGIWPGRINCLYEREVKYYQAERDVRSGIKNINTIEWSSIERTRTVGWAIPDGSFSRIGVRCDRPKK